MSNEELEHFKIVMLGDTGVGKTALVERLSDDIFSDAHFPTVGAQFVSLVMTVKDQKMVMELWDTAGQEVFRSLVGFYARDSAGALLLCDVSNQESFDGLAQWLTFIKENAPDAKIILFANKIDLADARVISSQKLQEFASKNDLTLFEGSAKTAENVQDAFETICEQVSAKIKPKNNTTTVDVQKEPTQAKKGCCK